MTSDPEADGSLGRAVGPALGRAAADVPSTAGASSFEASFPEPLSPPEAAAVAATVSPLDALDDGSAANSEGIGLGDDITDDDLLII